MLPEENRRESGLGEEVALGVLGCAGRRSATDTPRKRGALPGTPARYNERMEGRRAITSRYSLHVG